MTPGNVCYTAYMESMRLERPYLPRYVLLDVANKAAWEAAANAVSGDLIADNERLRAALEAQLSELMETYWWCYDGQQKALLRTALAQPAPDAVAKYRASIRREAFLEAAAHCRETELLMPCPEPGSTMRVHGANVCMALAAEIEAMAEREGNDEQVVGN